MQACLNFDEPRAEQTLTQAFALFPLNSVVLDVLLRGLAEIGEGWYRGEVAVQQEHFASALAVRRLQTLIAASPAPTRAERVVLACPPGEQHTDQLAGDQSLFAAAGLGSDRSGGQCAARSAGVDGDEPAPAVADRFGAASAHGADTADAWRWRWRG